MERGMPPGPHFYVCVLGIFMCFYQYVLFNSSQIMFGRR